MIEVAPSSPAVILLVGAMLLMTGCDAAGTRLSAGPSSSPAGTESRSVVPASASAAATSTVAAAPTVAPEAAPGELVVMTYNIRHAESPAGRYDLAAIADVIRSQRAALVALQEVDRRWGARSAFDDQPGRLAELTGLTPCYGPNLDRGGAQYGTLILSRYPLDECGNAPLPRLTAANEQRGVTSARIEVDGTPLRFYATHLQHNSAPERAVQVKALLDVIAAHPEPAILAGDFNAQPYATEIAPLTERFADAWAAWASASPGAGPGYSLPSSNPRSRIDYVFVPRSIRVVAARVAASPASDHLPVVVTLAVR